MTEQLKQQQQKHIEPANMVELQGSLINRLIKRTFPDKIVTQEFKKQFSRALTIFILYVQNGQAKKKYTKDDMIAFLEREGFGKVAEDLRKQRISHEEPASRKKARQQQKPK